MPIYWMIAVSLQKPDSLAGSIQLVPADPTFSNFLFILTEPDWYWGYINALTYVSLNVAISVCVAIPAAYAFSRFRFVGHGLLFFSLLMFRMMVPAILLVPFVQIFSALNMIDTYLAVALAHCFFSVPIAIWILEGFISAIPVEVDESAKVDGFSTFRFFRHILLPMIAPGVATAAFFCFMFSWVELLIARTLTVTDAKPIAAAMTRTVSASGLDWGVLAAAGILTIIPGALVIYFVRHHIAKGFALGRV